MSSSNNSNRNAQSLRAADANNDSFGFSEAIEGTTKYLDVMANDTGTGKKLWSIDDGSNSGVDLQNQDNIGSFGSSALGAQISITADGRIAYTYSADLDYLAAGQTITDTIAYGIKGSDGSFDWATATITITGTNDKPTFVLTGTDAVGVATEDTNVLSGKLTDSGGINFTDVDVRDTHTVKVKADDDNPLGGKLVATVNSTTGAADGAVTWTYSVDNARTQWLAEGQSVTESFKITIDDGNGGKITQVVTVTITGDNDAPTIVSSYRSDVEGAVVEDDLDQASTSGKIIFRDVDLTDDHTATSELANTTNDDGSPLGTLTLNVREGHGGHHGGHLSGHHNGWTNGRGHGEDDDHHGGRHDDDHGGHGSKGSVGWTYTINNDAAQSLAEGETVTETYTVTISDGNGGTDTETVTITIKGLPDSRSRK